MVADSKVLSFYLSINAIIVIVSLEILDLCSIVLTIVEHLMLESVHIINVGVESLLHSNAWN